MKFAEVFLRVGLALVAWMMLFTHFVWLAVLRVVECGPDGDEMYRLLLGLSPVTLGFAVALQVTRPYREIHTMLRWLGLPLLLLAPFCVRSAWHVFESVNLGGVAVCAAGQAPAWQVYWAPLQLVLVLLVLLFAARTWRNAAGDDSAAGDS